MIHAALDNRWDEARRIHYETYSLMRVNFVETNPVPVKAALGNDGLDRRGLPAAVVPDATEES